MPTPFKLRSGNTTPFKLMGSSPVRQKATLFQKLRAATKVIGAQLIKPKLKIKIPNKVKLTASSL